VRLTKIRKLTLSARARAALGRARLRRMALAPGRVEGRRAEIASDQEPGEGPRERHAQELRRAERPGRGERGEGAEGLMRACRALLLVAPTLAAAVVDAAATSAKGAPAAMVASRLGVTAR
jgi:hypothetical protein